MKKHDLDIEKMLLLVADMQKLGIPRDKLTRVISETASDFDNIYDELDESELEHVRAAALPSYQQFLKKYAGRL